jgi:hypothetical protein
VHHVPAARLFPARLGNRGEPLDIESLGRKAFGVVKVSLLMRTQSRNYALICGRNPRYKILAPSKKGNRLKPPATLIR